MNIEITTYKGKVKQSITTNTKIKIKVLPKSKDDGELHPAEYVYLPFMDKPMGDEFTKQINQNERISNITD